MLLSFISGYCLVNLWFAKQGRLSVPKNRMVDTVNVYGVVVVSLR